MSLAELYDLKLDSQFSCCWEHLFDQHLNIKSVYLLAWDLEIYLAHGKDLVGVSLGTLGGLTIGTGE